MVTITVFGLALFLLILLVLIKSFELKKGGENSILKQVGRLDQSTSRIFERVSYLYKQVTQSIRYIVLVRLLNILKDNARRGLEYSKKEYEARRGAIMGKRYLSHRGSASFYLKKIAEERENTGKGKIQDDSLPID